MIDNIGLRLVFPSVQVSRLYRGMCDCILILTCILNVLIYTHTSKHVFIHAERGDWDRV